MAADVSVESVREDAQQAVTEAVCDDPCRIRPFLTFPDEGLRLFR